jgi:hypothetical protein
LTGKRCFKYVTETPQIAFCIDKLSQEAVLPKENTHLLLINGVIDAMDCAEIRGILKANYESLCFGGIVADTFFYSGNKNVVQIAEELHGKEGERTNGLTFELLDHARRHRSEKVLCVSMGYISHCVFDMTLHPVIYYLTGNYYDKDATRSDQAVYRHRLMETKLDNDINNKYYLDKILDWNNKTVHEILELIAVRYNITNGDLVKAYKKQIRINKCFRSGFIYKLIHLLSKLHILDYKNILPLFYHHLQMDEIEIDETIKYCDIVSGKELQSNLTALLKFAEDESIKRIKAAFAYYNDMVGKADAMRIIRGESLDTGREDCPVHKVIRTV